MERSPGQRGDWQCWLVEKDTDGKEVVNTYTKSTSDNEVQVIILTHQKHGRVGWRFASGDQLVAISAALCITGSSNGLYCLAGCDGQLHPSRHRYRHQAGATRGYPFVYDAAAVAMATRPGHAPMRCGAFEGHQSPGMVFQGNAPPNSRSDRPMAAVTIVPTVQCRTIASC